MIIPAGNVKNLMLHREVVSAVEQGQFHIWSIQSFEEGLSLLSGYEAGEPQEDGSYDAGTFNRAVVQRLAEFTRQLEPSAEKAHQSHPKNEEMD